MPERKKRTIRQKLQDMKEARKRNAKRLEEWKQKNSGEITSKREE